MRVVIESGLAHTLYHSSLAMKVFAAVVLAFATLHANAVYNLDAVNKKYTEARGECVVETMPATLDQGGLPFCYAATAALLANEFKCFTYGNKRCEEVPVQEKVSLWDLARYARRLSTKADQSSRESYKGVQYGGSSYRTLLQLWYVDTVVPMSCVPENFSQIGADRSAIAESGLWKNLEKFHKSLAGAGVTLAVAGQIKAEYQLNQSAEVIQTALSHANWEVALEELLIPAKCRDDFYSQLSMGSKFDKPYFFPLENEKTTYKNTLTKLRELVCERKRPVSVDFCVADQKKFKSSAKCASAGLFHAVVVEGYREMCDSSGTKCVPSVKVRNSWGEKWQKDNNEGWIDAKTFLDSTYYDSPSLNWLEVKQ